MSHVERQQTSDSAAQNQTAAQGWLEGVLRTRVRAAVFTDLQAQLKGLREGNDRDFFKAFALLPRATGKAPCALTDDEQSSLTRVCDGLQPPLWRVDEVARLWLVLAGCADADALFRRVEALFAMSDVSEQVTLYRGLPLYPQAERWQARAAEGVRSNMKAVYEAVALHNPYPSRWLSDAAFNHLVVKALHVQSPLDAIVGLQERKNPELVRMLRDYVSERRSAKRAIDPALFQLIGEPASPSDTKGTDV